MVAPLANWATDRSNHTMRAGCWRSWPGFIRDAALPKYQSKPLDLGCEAGAGGEPRAPAFGRKAVLYATCFGNYNEPAVGMATRAVLARNGVETEVVYPHAAACRSWSKGESPRWPTTRTPWRRRCRTGSPRATTSSPWCRPAR